MTRVWDYLPVADRLILVNGLPGSGKTTLATRLAPALGVPLIAKDAIKEAVADVVPAAPSRALGMAASQMLWTLAAAISSTVLLESWWFRSRDLSFVETSLAECGDPAVVEIWCDIPAELSIQRCTARRRHPIHEDTLRLADPTWERNARQAAPLGVGPIVRVPTDRPVDIDALACRVTGAFAGMPVVPCPSS
ncbi:MAG: AAA family ATPase [Micromonosporaceae bacterium]|nr:AAA family ATPase [Micromonosporaceae bacterium]